MHGKRAWSGLSTLTALGGAASLVLGLAAFSFFYPDPTPGDPTQMVWDEDSVDGFHHLQLLDRAPGFKVFWWNMAWGQYNAAGPADRNIQELIRSDAAPDVLAFGEYKDIVFTDPNTLVKIGEKYPFKIYVPYNNGKGTDGVAVFSRYPFTSRVLANLDWSPLDVSSDKQDAYRQGWIQKFPETESWWNRPYLKLDIDYNGQHVGLVAEHLLEPWLEIHQAKGNAGLVEQIIFGKDNPLTHQIRRLKSEMRSDFGAGLDSMPLILVGDFNTLKGSWLDIHPTECYQLLSEGMSDVFMRQPKTFPSASAPDAKQEPFKTIGGIKIDHAFISGGMQAVGASVIPIQGSDHYPIYVIVKPGN
jgi:endonuclease/exonuclease/phosphatase family metal-dependent hydrolase